MKININNIRETLEIRKEDMLNNKALTNEYIIDDIMNELGYNKKRDRAVKIFNNKDIDWEVQSLNSTGKMAVKVVALGCNIEKEELESTIEFCKSQQYDLLIISDGYTIKIFRYKNDKQVYQQYKSINFNNDITELEYDILEAISKDGFNLLFMDNLMKSNIITKENIISALNDILNKENTLEKTICKHINKETNDDIEKCKEILLQLVSTKTDDNAGTLSGKNLVIDLLKAETEELREENKRLNEENKRLKEENESIKAQVENEQPNEKTEQVQSNDSKEIAEYRDQIVSLTNKLSDALENIDNLKKELKEAKNEIDNMSGVERKRSLELLNVIEDSTELDRHYVGVINTELIQFEELHTFIGRSLQKLYDIKAFEASQYIFNGDIFTLIQPAVHNDLMMNNKTYDIDLKSQLEDEALNKLRIVYSHFDDIVFECKKIGRIKEENNIKTDVTEETEAYTDAEEAENNENTENNKVEIHEDTEDFKEISKNVFENNNEIANEFEEQDTVQSLSIQDNNKLLVGQLLQIDQLIWTTDDIVFNTISYIGNNNLTFNINMNKQPISYDILLCRCIDAVLYMEECKENDSVISRLKQKELNLVNSFIKLYTEEYKGYTKINGTKYVIVGVESVQQVASILFDICNEMQIDTSDIFLYFDITSKSELGVSQNYEFPEEAIQLSDNIDYTNNSIDNESIAILRGDIFNNIVVTKNSLQAHRNILVKSLAIKTKYLAKTLITEEDVVEVIENMLMKAKMDGISVSYDMLGNVIGESYKIISNNEIEVGENSIKLSEQVGEVYCARLQNWQIPHSLIKLHTTIFSNTAIAIKNTVNTDAINFYSTEFVTSEPSLSLAVASFNKYIKDCIK